jgi:prophage DNA circulation protein
LTLKDNKLLTPEAGKALSDMLAANTVLKELDVSSNNWIELDRDIMGDGPGFAKELAVGISNNGAMTKLDMSENDFKGAAAGKAIGDMLDGTSTLTDLNLSSCYIDAYAAQGISTGLAGNEAILSVNLLKNDTGVEQARALVIILKEHSTLKSLCGNNGDETELDMSGKMHGAGDAIMLAAEIIDNGAITRLDARENCIDDEGKRALQQAAGSRCRT